MYKNNIYVVVDIWCFLKFFWNIMNNVFIVFIDEFRVVVICNWMVKYKFFLRLY